MKKLNGLVRIIIMSLIVVSCGGGGGGSGGSNNTPPVSNAGIDKNAINNALVILDGSQSSDVNGNPLTYKWTIVSKPAGSTATLSNPTSVTPSFTSDAAGPYTISLVVNDGTADSIPDMIIANVLPSISHIHDTGQYKCYNETSEIACGNAILGQDALYSTNPLRFVSTTATVFDSITGLMWQKNDNANKYNWYQAMGIFNATYNPGTTSVCGSLLLDGYSDWRLPSRRELMSIINYSQGGADTTYFQSSGADYWSSTSTAVSSDVAWGVTSNRVTYGFGDKGSSALYTRCVRGNDWGINSLVDNGDGTVTDNMSGLIWQKNDDSVARNWKDALNYCESLTLASSSNWRLPDIKELESLVNIDSLDNTPSMPAVNTTYFPTIQNSYYWSSTTVDNFNTNAWAVDFAFGWVDYGHTNKSGFLFTRCVK